MFTIYRRTNKLITIWMERFRPVSGHHRRNKINQIYKYTMKYIT